LRKYYTAAADCATNAGGFAGFTSSPHCPVNFFQKIKMINGTVRIFFSSYEYYYTSFAWMRRRNNSCSASLHAQMIIWENSKMTHFSKKNDSNCPFWIECNAQCMRRLGGVYIPLPHYTELLCKTRQYTNCSHYLLGSLVAMNKAEFSNDARVL